MICWISCREWVSCSCFSFPFSFCSSFSLFFALICSISCSLSFFFAPLMWHSRLKKIAKIIVYGNVHEKWNYIFVVCVWVSILFCCILFTVQCALEESIASILDCDFCSISCSFNICFFFHDYYYLVWI